MGPRRKRLKVPAANDKPMSTPDTASVKASEIHHEEADVVSVPDRARRVAAHASGTGTGQSRVSTRRKRITPFQAKRVAARQKWRCAMCGELLTEDFECDHVVPLHRNGSFDNDIDSLQAFTNAATS